MKIYISGKITGIPINEAIKEFKNAENVIKKQGHTPLNPFKISPFSEEKKWTDYMIDDIKALFECDAIYMLRNYKESKGARIEYAIAQEIGLKIMHQY